MIFGILAVLLGCNGMINKKFWSGKKVFITGNTGFKGAWLSKWLLSLGSELKGFSDNIKPVSLFNILELSKYSETIIDDIRNREVLDKEIRIFDPDIIIHMAAQPLVRESYDDPLGTFEINAIGTANVCEVSKNLDNLNFLLNITTDKVYSNDESGKKFIELDRLGGYDPYSASKSCSELILHAYNTSFFKSKNLLSATARSGNVIGGGDFAKDRIIPDIYRSIYNNTSLEIRNPYSVRPWQHVLEPIYGYILLIEKSINENLHDDYPAYNFGPNDESFINVEDLVNLASAFLPNPLDITSEKINSSLHEAEILKLNIKKSKEILNWKPSFSVNNTIKATMDWYIAFLQDQNMIDFTESQIADYETLLE